MAKRVTLSDIAKVLNVSNVTVSKALSGQKGVSEELREKIRRLADQMGYRQPSSKRNNSSKNIGVIVPGRYFEIRNSFYWYMYQELATVAVKEKCFTMLEVIEPEDEEKHELPKLIQENKVDGIILLGRPKNGYIKTIREESSLPMVCLDFFDDFSNCDSVISDGFYGTYMLTNYLFRMGHTDIAYVGTLLYTGSITDRYLGYCKSMMEHGQEIRKEWILDDRDWATGDVLSFEFKLPEKMPTAFVCNCDLTASLLIKHLRKLNYRVPEDISVVGFDNYLYPGLSDIGITTYDVNVREMVKKSISILLDRINHVKIKPGVRIVQGEIVYKESVMPPNKDKT
ncbi:HTH-type transcriptional repressor PurR [Thermoclostridium stercorarium subsp. stercorarium DSM 8532]|uniref:HTH-type transcriptional repressor PurR n=4 Tax=Thermoclostridium stercorarium TaxID=1510 RepID=L7VPI8_THES1|nr:substrate-binding domain-containing protein [Thermoclostridium stercorarium]AGC67488.1 HTH-type transcriptional repressor PurR [Thermoclostridium stercorarium subsp. stercorarium DSM 8532]AGI38543.1 transcriptional regulator [Thermoclostridium stercorarium subsp. stercorarium DSM 8532]ANW97916.1 transcriptional regulator [Thermoclostridium stercorarium subsp. thermolacticum DSM 2910]ANX00466.1 transcriptional regulator [Thermoclostridium stercorarium subsp. leptospartum DSM 9219]